MVIQDLASAYLRAAEAAGGGNLTLRWACDRLRLDGETARLVLNVILLARDALPRGGQITVEITPDRPETGAGLVIAYSGPGARLGDELTQALTTDSPPTGPRGAQAGFTRLLAAQFGATLRLEGGSDQGRVVI
jgi:histidine phosphotransferase ChpT